MAANKIQLQLAKFPRRDLDIGQFAEAGADAVNHPAPRHDLLDDLSGRPNTRVSGRGHFHRRPP